MKNWSLDTIAKVGTASVSFVTLALLAAGFFVGIATEGDLDNVETSLREDIAQIETALEEDITRVEAALKEDLAQVAAIIAESEARIFAALESLRAEMRALNARIDRHLEGHAE